MLYFYMRFVTQPYVCLWMDISVKSGANHLNTLLYSVIYFLYMIHATHVGSLIDICTSPLCFQYDTHKRYNYNIRGWCYFIIGSV